MRFKEKEQGGRPTRDCQISDAAITGWYGRDRRESAASMKLSAENAKTGVNCVQIPKSLAA